MHRIRHAISVLIPLLLASTAYADEVVNGVTTDEIRRQVEAAADRYVYFATEDIISNRPTQQGWLHDLIVEQANLMTDLRNWSIHPKALTALIDHPDGRVRTLVLGALFVGENPQHLPLMASLVDDKSLAFKHVPFSLNSFGMRGNQGKTVDDPQTVGEVAQTMVSHYVQQVFQKPGTGFTDYWQARKDRKHCASWFLIRFQRATRNQTPTQTRYQQDIQRVIDDLNTLPVAERAWTQVYLRCRSASVLEQSLTDEPCIAALKEIGPYQIVRLLKREKFSDDPDLQLQEPGGARDVLHSWMSHFILRRAHGLLRVQDVPVLLECEDVGRKTPLLGASPYWAAVAAELVGESDPDAASEIIESALKRFPLSDVLGGTQQAVLIGSLWRIHGARKKEQITDWFYQAQSMAIERKSGYPNHGPEAFLNQVLNDKRSDTKELMSTLVTDLRFDLSDFPVMKAMLEIASDGLAEPLVSQEKIYSVWRAQQNQDEVAQKVFADWRQLLISHYAQ